MRSKNILLVDDNADVRRSLGRFLRNWGFEVIEAANGQEALHRLADGQIVAAILVDEEMPVMRGHVFVERLEQEFPDLLSRTISIGSQPHATSLCLCRLVMPKPIVPRLLKLALEELVPRP